MEPASDNLSLFFDAIQHFFPNQPNIKRQRKSICVQNWKNWETRKFFTEEKDGGTSKTSNKIFFCFILPILYLTHQPLRSPIPVGEAFITYLSQDLNLMISPIIYDNDDNAKKWVKR